MRRPLRSGLGSRGFLSAGTAAVLAVSSLAMVVGTGFSFGETRLKDGVTWIFDRQKGEAVQVNGSSGRVGARIVMPGTKGEDIVLVQREGQVWAVDQRSGEAASLDVNGLKVKARTDFGTKDDIQPVLGDDAGFLVNRQDGTIQRIDPSGMQALGEPWSAGAGLSNAVADDAGHLWVARNATGEIIRIDPDGPAGLVEGVRKKLAAAGSRLEVTLTDDGIVVTDAKTGEQWRLDGDGNEIGGFQADLPVPPPPDVSVTPSYSSGPYVPIVAPSDGGYAVVPPPTQPGGGGGPAKPVPMADLPANLPPNAPTDPAVTLGDRIYVPVPGESVLIVLDLQGTYLDTIAVPGEGGFQLILDDGHLWVNDPDDPEALRIDADGTVKTIEKSAPDVPITPPKDDPKPPKDDKGPKPPTEGGNNPTTTTTTAPPPTTVAPPASTTTTTQPRPTTTVKDPDPPGAVTGLAAAGGDGTVRLAWKAADAGGGKISGYLVTWQPKGTCPNKVKPKAGRQQAGANAGGAAIAGLSNECAYAFTVVASNQAGAGTPASTVGTPSATQPAAPAPPTASTEHATGETRVSWTEPDLKGQVARVYWLLATDTLGNRVSFNPIDAGTTAATVPAAAAGGPGTLVLGRTYTFTVAVVTTKVKTTSPQSPPSNQVEVFAGPSHINVTSARIGPQTWRYTVDATWQGRAGQISAAGGATGSQDGSGPVTYDVTVPWGGSVNTSFAASVPDAPDARPQQAEHYQENPLPQFGSDPSPVWGACVRNPAAGSGVPADDEVYEQGYWEAAVNFAGAESYVQDVQSTWEYAYGTDQPAPTQSHNTWSNPAPTQLVDGRVQSYGRRHEDSYTYFVQFRFRVEGYDGWITSSAVRRNSPNCPGDD